jgi:hypothetical protein
VGDTSTDSLLRIYQGVSYTIRDHFQEKSKEPKAAKVKQKEKRGSAGDFATSV